LKKPRYDSEFHNKKRGYQDDDEDEEIESDDEDVGGLMRVTVVSRRKRIKVFQVLPSGEGPSSSGFSTPGQPPLQPATKSIFAQSTLGGKATDEFIPSTDGSEMENT